VALVPDKNATVVVYCASATCRNSDIAASQFTALGFADVRVYVEGKKDWMEAGLPVVREERAA
jgi:rhodanese-related sulfurtransferase